MMGAKGVEFNELRHLRNVLSVVNIDTASSGVGGNFAPWHRLNIAAVERVFIPQPIIHGPHAYMALSCTVAVLIMWRTMTLDISTMFSTTSSFGCFSQSLPLKYNGYRTLVTSPLVMAP